jgi:hypothetical protein
MRGGSRLKAERLLSDSIVLKKSLGGPYRMLVRNNDSRTLPSVNENFSSAILGDFLFLAPLLSWLA